MVARAGYVLVPIIIRTGVALLGDKNTNIVFANNAVVIIAMVMLIIWRKLACL